VPLKQVMIAAQASYLEQVPSPTPGT